jgi:GntP family gluconate:H+ symporter
VAGNIGILIALASIIGLCLLESGAADRIVRRLLRLCGPNGAALALLMSGFILSIPVFFDTVLFLLLPIARALTLRTGRNFMLYVMVMTGGAAITHSLVPPTPGPLLMAEALRLDLGTVLLAGLLAGLLPALAVYAMAHGFNRRVPVPLRETAGAPLADLRDIVQRPDTSLPPLWLSLLPVLLPTVLITLASCANAAAGSWSEDATDPGSQSNLHTILTVLTLLGNKHLALLLGAAVSMILYWRQARISLAEVNRKLGPALETAGMIILITAAGGAFGAMIRHSGVGDAVRLLAEGHAVNLILLAWLVTAVVRVAQGSATVAMITGSGLMYAVIGDGATLPYHAVYIYLAVGFGSVILSWMNDSGFWLVSRMCGFTERETLRTWTLLETGISVVGLVETLILAHVLPFK